MISYCISTWYENRVREKTGICIPGYVSVKLTGHNKEDCARRGEDPYWAFACRRDRIDDAIIPVTMPEPTVQIITHQTSWVSTPPRKNFMVGVALAKTPGANAS